MLTLLLFVLETEDDKNLLAEVYYEYKKYLLAVAESSLADDSYVEDCIHNTFVELVASFEEFKKVHKSKRLSYISTICRRSAYKLNNVNSREISLNDSTDVNYTDIDETGFSAFDRVELALIINKMDSKYREPIIMKYLGQCSTAEIAEALGISENLVLQRIYRGKKILIELMAEE